MGLPCRLTLLGIRAARGVAALLVLVFHAERAVSLPQYLGHQPLGGITGFGHAGVDFFVLSGFIIYAVRHGDIGQPGRFARYAGRRLSRIYPPYWVVTAGVLLLTLVGAGPANLVRAGVVGRRCKTDLRRGSWAEHGS